MKLLEKLKNRYNILILTLTVMLLTLSFRLATLTIVQGDYYRDISDNKRLKEIYITAPRGEIRDRYGRLLAGNKPSFTVQLLKDEIKTKDKKNTNNTLLTLARLLEEDGVDYVDDFPIEFNIFKFNSEDVYGSENMTPEDKVIDIIVENNLLPQILDTYYIHPTYEEHFQFITINKAINALEGKGIDVPILAELTAEGLKVSFDESKDIDLWKGQHNISIEATPKQAIISLINGDKNIIRKIIDHPISRELVFNIIKEKNLNQGLILEGYSLAFDEEYLQQKRDLMKEFDGVTFQTVAKDDFINIVMSTSINNLLEKVVDEEDEKGDITKIIPGKLLIEQIEQKGLNSPVTIEVNEETNTVLYTHKDKQLSSQENPLDTLIAFAKKEDLLKDFITDDQIKGIAQEIILEKGINPKISISKWEYVSLLNKKDWFDKYKLPRDKTAEKTFFHLRDHFEIEKDLSKYESRTIMSLYDQLDKQGQRAYQPINIAYGIKDSTVAKIEEGLMEMPGIQVSIEPVRYYPQGELAAHLLGYLGKISQPSEIEKYVNENKYSPNDIIGKTGIEEKFESELRGKSGVKRVEVDVYGNTTNVIDEEQAMPGNNIYLTIDSKLQQVAEDSLKHALEEIQKGGTFESKWGNYKFGINRKKGRPYVNATSGSVVAIDVKTGELLALANYPAYDPNLFSTGISSSDWVSLFPENEEDLLAPRPLYNIAIQTAVQPGSTFKMVTALAALEKGFSPTKTIRDMGRVDIGVKTFGCWLWNSHGGTHGYENVYDALRDSCNYYFYSLALGKNQKTGESLGIRVDIEDIVNISKQLGLNDKTGIEIDIPNEVAGGVPDPQRKIMITKSLLKRYLNNNIRLYIKEDVEFKDEEIAEIIDEILSWIEEPEPLSRNEVIRRLDQMGFYPEKVLPGDRSGLADKIKFDYINQAGWNITDTLNITIGQGQNAYTPIQMANFIATIANGGYRHKVTTIDNIKNFDNSKVIKETEVNPERIQLNDYENLEHVKLGMKKVSTEGTARSLFNGFPVTVASKTGTAQKSGINPATGDTYDDYAWFVAFAPYEDPEIAVAVVLFQGGSGGYAGPIAREIIAEYLGFNSVDKKGALPFEIELAR
ncbi:penicillin-binding transpeptidase domain-containing protein [Clostridium sp. Cult3]|uniref:penicillin-binding transpeptidase domain-containing protein n=1 Tax=Clostridium sp. Cult3 TaxID=2079004 RepID=UPI0023512BBA|nr:penicillin-binding transpeptidase domain-containing protein [Clostridium sp. Cult3]MCF6460593.1 penicillin-binding protein [Clostridium sp. Cult3]